jgi:hypothetical protein
MRRSSDSDVSPKSLTQKADYSVQMLYSKREFQAAMGKLIEALQYFIIILTDYEYSVK